MTDRIAVRKPNTIVQTAARKGVVQRKCACGGTPGPTGECTACRRKHAPGQLLQTKMTINAPGDKYEQEADRMAEQVMRSAGGAMPVPVTPISPLIQRKGLAVEGEEREEDEERLVQAKAEPGYASAGEYDTASVAQAVEGGGRPLSPTSQKYFGRRFGHDFSRVRIHTGEHASRAARSIHARAFTVGENIVFGAGQFGPHREAGKRLLAHELTHVVQQGAAPNSRYIQRDLATPLPEEEPEAQEDLTDEEIEEAIQFNRARYNVVNTRLIQDLVGTEQTGTWSRADIEAIAAIQEQYGLDKDGKVGFNTFRFLDEELRHEGIPARSEDCLTSFRIFGPDAASFGPDPSTAGQHIVSGHFRTESQFAQRCDCSDFEYRQFIRGHFDRIRGGVTTDLSGIFGDLPSGSLTTNFQEDGDTSDTVVNYGHRSNPADNNPEDHYIDDTGADDQADGCRYRNEDFPGAIVFSQSGDVFDVDINFRGEIQRNGSAVRRKHWTAIRGRFRVP